MPRTSWTLLPMPSRALSVGALRDGTPARIRPLVPRDRAPLAERFRALSAETRHARFLAPVDRLTERDLQLLVDDVDGETHVALVLEAVDPDGVGHGIGVGRYVRWPERADAADVAFTVDDAWHGRGCGRLLGRAVAGHARRSGVRVLTADVHEVNTRCLRLLSGLGALTPTGSDGGVLGVEVDLTAAPASAAGRVAVRAA